MIVNLRGTNGSGKSFVGHALVKEAIRRCEVPPGHPLNSKSKPRIVGYELPGDLIVLGRYEAVCGGVEGWTASDTRELVKMAALHWRYVFFEGYFTSVTVKPWLEVIDEMSTGNDHWADHGLGYALPFVILGLNTPFETCIDRIHSRTGEIATRGKRKGKTLNVEVQRSMFDNMHKRVMPKMIAAAEARGPAILQARYIDYTTALDEVKRTLTEGGWAG